MVKVLSTAKRLARYSAVPPRRRPGQVVVGYIGWTGEGNLGDEAMYIAHQLAYPAHFRFVGLPIAPPNWILDNYAGPRLDAVSLGGGTLVGNGYFRSGFEAVLRSRPDLPGFVLGVGCEDHTYVEGNRAGVRAELARWPELLARFPDVRVRGPLSQETLRTVGVDSEVSADPAMLLPAFDMPAVRRRVGVNIGVVDDSWAGAGAPLPRVIETVLAHAQEDGREVLLLPTTVEDHALCRTHPTLRSLPCSDAVLRNDVYRFLRDAATCEVVVGMKLHALVLASTQYVPTVALEYRPKCRDFMMTIERGHRTMRLDEFDGAQLGAWISEDLHDRERQAAALRQKVILQRDRLRAAAEHDAARLGLVR